MASWVNLSSNHLWKNSNSIETIPEKWRNANSFYRASTVLTAKLDVLQKNYRPISLKDTDAKLLWNTARQINNILREVNMTSRGSLRSLRLGQHLGGGKSVKFTQSMDWKEKPQHHPKRHRKASDKAYPSSRSLSILRTEGRASLWQRHLTNTQHWHPLQWGKANSSPQVRTE